MLGYLSLDIICSSKLTVFLELCSRKTVRFSEQIRCGQISEHIFAPNEGYCLYSVVLCYLTVVVDQEFSSQLSGALLLFFRWFCVDSSARSFISNPL